MQRDVLLDLRLNFYKLLTSAFSVVACRCYQQFKVLLVIAYLTLLPAANISKETFLRAIAGVTLLTRQKFRHEETSKAYVGNRFRINHSAVA